MAYVNSGCFFEVVVPLLMMRTCAFIGITTISGKSNNFVNSLIERKVFKYLEISTTCESCRLAGIIENCEHKRGNIPSWQTEESRELTKRIYGPDRQEQYVSFILPHCPVILTKMNRQLKHWEY